MHEDTAFARIALGRLLASRRCGDAEEAEAFARAAASQYAAGLNGLRLNRHFGLGNLRALGHTAELAALHAGRLGDLAAAEPLLRRVVSAGASTACTYPLDLLSIHPLDLLRRVVSAGAARDKRAHVKQPHSTADATGGRVGRGGRGLCPSFSSSGGGETEEKEEGK